MSTMTELLRGRRLLLVEDDFFVAFDFAETLREGGAEVVGPAATIDDALDLIEAAERLDGAVVDINLGGEMAYEVADALRARGVPFVFATGYDQASIPAAYADAARCEKPVDAPSIARALFGRAGPPQA